MSQSPDDTVTQSLVLTLKGIESGATLTNGYRTSDTRITIDTSPTLGPSTDLVFHDFVLPVEDQQWQWDSRDDAPGQKTKELCLDTLSDVTMSHEGVQDPECDVGKQHEGDDLSAWLGLLLSSGGTNSPWGLTDYHTWTISIMSLGPFTTDLGLDLFVF